MTLIAADDRAYLTAEVQQRYELSNPATGAVITSGAADDRGVMWLWEEPEGWDAPEVNTPSDELPWGHGSALGLSTLTERVLTVTGSAACPSIAEAHAARKRLLGLALSALGGYLRYEHLDDDPAKHLWVRPNGRPRAELNGRWLDFSVVLIADDPVKQGEADTYGPGHLRTTGGGVRSPLRAPLSAYSAPAAPDWVQVPNDGDEPAHAVYSLTGPVPEPVVLLDTGEQVNLALTLGADDTVVIDTRAGTVRLNGLDRFDVWGPGSVMPLIRPGGAQVRLDSAAGGTDPAAALYVTTAPAWK